MNYPLQKQAFYLRPQHLIVLELQNTENRTHGKMMNRNIMKYHNCIIFKIGFAYDYASQEQANLSVTLAIQLLVFIVSSWVFAAGLAEPLFG